MRCASWINSLVERAKASRTLSDRGAAKRMRGFSQHGADATRRAGQSTLIAVGKAAGPRSRIGGRSGRVARTTCDGVGGGRRVGPGRDEASKGRRGRLAPPQRRRRSRSLGDSPRPSSGTPTRSSTTGPGAGQRLDGGGRRVLRARLADDTTRSGNGTARRSPATGAADRRHPPPAAAGAAASASPRRIAVRGCGGRRPPIRGRPCSRAPRRAACTVLAHVDLDYHLGGFGYSALAW